MKKKIKFSIQLKELYGTLQTTDVYEVRKMLVKKFF